MLDGQLILGISSDILIFNMGLHVEGLSWERYVWKGQIAFEAIIGENRQLVTNEPVEFEK